MSTPSARREFGAVHVLLVVIGALALLVSLGLLAGGSVLTWADRTQRDSGGYISTGLARVDSSAYAVVARDVSTEVPGWFTGPDRLGNVRITVAPADAGGQLFLGIAPRSSVDAYLAGVERDQVSAWRDTMGLDHLSGTAPGQPPGSQAFWVVSSSGAGAQSVTWEVRGGDWAVVAMRPDASRGLVFDARAAATAPFLLAVGVGLLIAGVIVGLLGIFFVVMGARPRASLGATTTASGAGHAGTGLASPQHFTVYPVAVHGHLEEPLNRWLWLVKWLLALPHYLILALLSIAFSGFTFFAFVAILVTGRYPRSLFDFNLGVLRWWWRAGFYSYSALGTDRYPPFSLGEEPDYPARLDIAYPERLSRGLVLVKSWLLAIPHLVIVAILLGGLGFRGWPWGAGLIGLLVLVAGIVLLASQRYNRPIFDLVMGLNRWVFRVGAYVFLMRDEYPPFRLDLGENEPEMAGTAPPLPPPAPMVTPRPAGT